MTRYAVLSCIVLLPSAPSVSAQALLDQTTYGNFAAGSVRGIRYPRAWRCFCALPGRSGRFRGRPRKLHLSTSDDSNVVLDLDGPKRSAMIGLMG